MRGFLEKKKSVAEVWIFLELNVCIILVHNYACGPYACCFGELFPYWSVIEWLSCCLSDPLSY